MDLKEILLRWSRVNSVLYLYNNYSKCMIIIVNNICTGIPVGFSRRSSCNNGVDDRLINLQKVVDCFRFVRELSSPIVNSKC